MGYLSGLFRLIGSQGGKDLLVRPGDVAIAYKTTPLRPTSHEAACVAIPNPLGGHAYREFAPAQPSGSRSGPQNRRRVVTRAQFLVYKMFRLNEGALVEDAYCDKPAPVFLFWVLALQVLLFHDQIRDFG